MAEREGFEPSEPVKAQRFSRPPRSTTPASLHVMTQHLTTFGGWGKRAAGCAWAVQRLRLEGAGAVGGAGFAGGGTGLPAVPEHGQRGISDRGQGPRAGSDRVAILGERDVAPRSSRLSIPLWARARAISRSGPASCDGRRVASYAISVRVLPRVSRLRAMRRTCAAPGRSGCGATLARRGAARLEATAPLAEGHGLAQIKRWAGGRAAGGKVACALGDGVVQPRLGLLRRKQVMPSPVPDMLTDPALREDGVAREDRAAERQTLEPGARGGDLVVLGLAGGIADDDRQSGGERRDDARRLGGARPSVFAGPEPPPPMRDREQTVGARQRRRDRQRRYRRQRNPAALAATRAGTLTQGITERSRHRAISKLTTLQSNPGCPRCHPASGAVLCIRVARVAGLAAVLVTFCALAHAETGRCPGSMSGSVRCPCSRC